MILLLAVFISVLSSTSFAQNHALLHSLMSAGGACYHSSVSAPNMGFLGGEWRMENNWNDTAGTGNGTPFNSPLFGAPQVGSFSGSFSTNQYIDLGNPTPLNRGASFTISAWVKPTGVTGTQGIITKISSANTKQWGLSLNGNAIQFVLEASSNNFFVSGGTITPGIWTHVAATVSAGSPATVNIYKNGTPVGSGSSSATPTSGVVVNIGRWGGSYNSNYFNGLIDEISFWTTPFTDAEMKILYDQQSCGKN